MSPEMMNGIFAISGAVVGALLTGGLSLYQARSASRSKELTITSKHPSRLVELDQQFSQHVEVRVGGKVVPTVYVVDFTVLNSGSDVLYELDVPVLFKGDGDVLAVSLGYSNFSCTPEDCRVEQRDSHSVVLRIRYLNPGDHTSARVILSGRPSQFINDFRQPEVKCRQRINLEGTETGAIAEVLYQTIRFNRVLDVLLKLALPAYRRYRRASKPTKQSSETAESPVVKTES